MNLVIVYESVFWKIVHALKYQEKQKALLVALSPY